MTQHAGLLADLQTNLWASLRHVFNTDRILLAVTYATNAFGLILLAATVRGRPLAAAVTSLALITFTALVMLSLANSRRQARSLLKRLAQLYADHELARYFDDSQLEYYDRRYTLWLTLAPTLCAFAIALGYALGTHAA